MKPHWKYAMSIYLPKHHCTLYRDNGLGVQLQILTRRSPSLFRKQERSYYFIDNVDGVFHSEEALVQNLAKRKPE